MISTIVCGRWNRFSAEYPETVHLRQTRNFFDDGQRSAEELAEAQNAVTRLLIKKLEETGAACISDGSIRWDSMYDITRLIVGCGKFEHLAPLPHSNFFHRQPAVTLPLAWEQSLLYTDYLFAKVQTDLPLTLSLPGPLSTALQTQNYKAYGLERVAEHYAKVFNQELKFILRFKDIPLVRIEEPHLLDHPNAFDTFKKVTATLVSGLDCSRLALASIGNITGFFDIFKLPFGIFFLDFTRETNNPVILKNLPKGKKIVAGIVNARSPYQETPTELRRSLQDILRNLPVESLVLAANTDWHFLPWNKALEKIKRLVEAGKRV